MTITLMIIMTIGIIILALVLAFFNMVRYMKMFHVKHSYNEG